MNKFNLLNPTISIILYVKQYFKLISNLKCVCWKSHID